jgi:putative heme-binding domain-containing protein
MRQFLILPVVCCAFLSAQPAELQNPRTSPDDVAQGAKTFRSHCASCHGLHGEGGVGPRLAGGRFYHGSTDADLLNNISDGIPGTGMPGNFYSPDRIWQVIAYIRSLNQGHTSAVPGDAAAGKAVYSSSGCAKCHRIQGEGGRLGPDLTYIGRTRSPEHLRDSVLNPNADVEERYWVVEATGNDGTRYSGFLMNEDTYTIQFLDSQEQLRSLNKDTLSSCKVTKESRMPSFRGKLTDAQITDLVAYLASLRPSIQPQGNPQ